MQADNARRLEQIIRIGTIADIDHARALCRVACGNLTSDWLPWRELRTGATRTWNPPTLGEQCEWISPSGNSDGGGYVAAGLYSANAPSTDPHETLTIYPDGARISYNHGSGALNVSGIKTATVQATEHVTVDCPESTLTGNVTIKGDLTIEGKTQAKALLSYASGMTGKGGATINGIAFETHTHSGVQSGGSKTGAPQ